MEHLSPNKLILISPMDYYSFCSYLIANAPATEIIFLTRKCPLIPLHNSFALISRSCDQSIAAWIAYFFLSSLSQSSLNNVTLLVILQGLKQVYSKCGAKCRHILDKQMQILEDSSLRPYFHYLSLVEC